MKIKLSIILLDWSVREYFQALHFLRKQSVPRDQYELIWVELYDYKTVPEIVSQTVDRLICCHQKGVYDKHKGYNAGLLAARGELVCICDSDAVFPFDFVEKILHYFYGPEMNREPDQKILQIYERRCAQSVYPGTENIDLATIEKDYFWKTWENVSACGVFRKKDMIAFGGLDEHHTFRGFFCGYNELVNRLVNAGWEEYWMPDSQLAIWHFKHQRPVDTTYGMALLNTVKEFAADEIDGLGILAVEAAASGRIHPLKENPEIFRLRMSQRKFGSDYERKYTDPAIYRRQSYKRYTFGWCSKLKCLLDLLRYGKYLLIMKLISEMSYLKFKQKLTGRKEEIRPPCAVVLAGGLGTRLRSVVADRQKVAAEVSGEPFIRKILRQLSGSGIRSVILCVGHQAETVEESVAGGFPDLEIIYSREKAPLGTAGAVRQGLTRTNSAEVLVLNGDSYLDADLNAFLSVWRAADHPVGMLLREVDDVSRYGRVTLDESGNVLTFDEKGQYAGKGHINAGIYAAKREFLEKLLTAECGSLEKDYFPELARQGKIFGCPVHARFIDIGTPESYAEAQHFFKESEHE